jgi:uncharacterized protein YndB with AHSA1/START domain
MQQQQATRKGDGTMSANVNGHQDRTIVIERTYDASIDAVWNLWTTKDGVESWWGPGGFSVEVHEMDVRPGGAMLYAMTAVEPAQVRSMKQANMPLTTEGKLVYTEVDDRRRIGYTHRADFIPGVDPYDVGNRVDFQQDGDRVRMTLRLDPMHSDEWTKRAVMGMESQLEKLAGVLQSKAVSA